MNPIQPMNPINPINAINPIISLPSEVILSEESLKSKKKRNPAISSASKTNLWNVFETEVINPEKQKDPLEMQSLTSLILN